MQKLQSMQKIMNADMEYIKLLNVHQIGNSFIFNTSFMSSLCTDMITQTIIIWLWSSSSQMYVSTMYQHAIWTCPSNQNFKRIESRPASVLSFREAAPKLISRKVIVSTRRRPSHDICTRMRTIECCSACKLHPHFDTFAVKQFQSVIVVGAESSLRNKVSVQTQYSIT